MRGSDWFELAGDLLPRRWRYVVVPLAVVVLWLSGTFEAVIMWLINDKEASILEDVIEPIFTPLIENLGPRPRPG